MQLASWPCSALPCLALLRHRRPTAPCQRADESSTALLCPKASARLDMQIPQHANSQPHAMTRHSARHSRGWPAQTNTTPAPLPTYLTPTATRTRKSGPPSAPFPARCPHTCGWTAAVRCRRAVRCGAEKPPPTHQPASSAECRVAGRGGGNNGSRGACYASQSKSGPLRTTPHLWFTPSLPPRYVTRLHLARGEDSEGRVARNAM
jgi:hypothetical protein